MWYPHRIDPFVGCLKCSLFPFWGLLRIVLLFVVRDMYFHFSVCRLRSRMAGLCANSVANILKNCQTSFPSGCMVLHSCYQITGSHFLAQAGPGLTEISECWDFRRATLVICLSWQRWGGSHSMTSILSGSLSLASFHVVIGYSAFMCLGSSERQIRELCMSLVWTFSFEILWTYKEIL